MKILSDDEIKEIKEEYLKYLGNVIKTGRSIKNIPQDELAKAINVDRTALSRFESGTRDINASLLPLISIYCDFSMSKYFNAKQDQEIFEKFRRIVRVEAEKLRRISKKDRKSRKVLKEKVYIVDGKEIVEPAVQRKNSRLDMLLEGKENFPVLPLSEKEFIEYVRTLSDNISSIIYSSDDMLSSVSSLNGKETIKGEIADFVIKELIAKPIVEDKANENEQLKRLYMLYKSMLDGIAGNEDNTSKQ